MKIDITGKDPYSAVADFVTRLIEERNACFDDCIVTLRTTILGESNEVLILENGYDEWSWDNDWYEGGEVEVLAVVPVIDLNIKDIPENLLNQTLGGNK